MIVQVDDSAQGGSTAYAAVTGSIRLGSLFLTLPTRALTGQQELDIAGGVEFGRVVTDHHFRALHPH
jgi:hypothetical protein